MTVISHAISLQGSDGPLSYSMRPLANAFKFTRNRPVAQIEVGWLPAKRHHFSA
jgi:hypothetical protein